jgi:hypothetical protein
VSYTPEEVKTLHCSDRRIRDAYPAPKRREGDVKKFKCDHVSQRELDLLALIDGHIARIAAERSSQY